MVCAIFDQRFRLGTLPHFFLKLVSPLNRAFGMRSQFAVSCFDLREHFIEGSYENSHLVRPRDRNSRRIIALIRNRARHLEQRRERRGDDPLQISRDQYGEKRRDGEHYKHQPAVLSRSMRDFFRVGLEADNADLATIELNRPDHNDAARQEPQARATKQSCIPRRPEPPDSE